MTRLGPFNPENSAANTPAPSRSQDAMASAPVAASFALDGGWRLVALLATAVVLSALVVADAFFSITAHDAAVAAWAAMAFLAFAAIALAAGSARDFGLRGVSAVRDTQAGTVKF